MDGKIFKLSKKFKLNLTFNKGENYKFSCHKYDSHLSDNCGYPHILKYCADYISQAI